MFVGAPGDGSVFLNSMKLWAMREAGLVSRPITDAEAAVIAKHARGGESIYAQQLPEIERDLAALRPAPGRVAG